MNITECFKFVNDRQNDNYTTTNKLQQLNVFIRHNFSSTSTLFKGVFLHTDVDQRPTTELKNDIMVQLVRAVVHTCLVSLWSKRHPHWQVSMTTDRAGGKKSFVSSTCVVVLLISLSIHPSIHPDQG